MNRWIAGLEMFAEKPWTGFGPGTYQFKYIPYQKPEFMSRLTVRYPWHIPENSGGTAHSEYILAISEMGIFGILALLFIFIYLIWIAFAKARFHPQRETIIVAFCVLATYLFHALFNNFLNTDKFAFLFWGSAAWIISLFKIQPENKVF
jgi:O-antigen ligase